MVASKRAEPADDLLSGLWADGGLDAAEIAGMALLLLVAGHETTANMLGLGAYVLMRMGQQHVTMTEPVVEELLRYLSVPHLGPLRAALEDVEIAGQTIKKGQVVTISIPAANRDPERFPDPEHLDLVGGAAGGQLAFGHGVHQCLGHQLARVELRIGYRALFERFPGLRVAVHDEEIPLRTDMSIYGVHRLPVIW
ncbi:cytochrome P450 [Nonomuraea sediminis]|uniref:cytochrome P450 n=1 Tax=Nonomuraea sediminis TaxID=2835864 RepID=UPI00202A8B52|nr:cytochrome P450 [Nonomuraea sediminis]